MSFTTVAHCGNDHHTWTNSLDFYKKEFEILGGRLDEIAQKNNSKEAMEGVEHFQNQFLIQKNNIDELKHTVQLHADIVAKQAKEHAGKMETGLTIEHEKLEENINGLERIVNDLRHEFNLFLAKWM